MHPLNPHGDLALFELERHRLMQEIASARARPGRPRLTARWRARLVSLFHRDA